MTRGLVIDSFAILGKGGEHVKFSLDTGRNKWPALWWNRAGDVGGGRTFDRGMKVDAAYKLQWNFYAGNKSPQMVLLDLKPSNLV
jgi:single-stranded-DNA-specific exonuclease